MTQHMITVGLGLCFIFAAASIVAAGDGAGKDASPKGQKDATPAQPAPASNPHEPGNAPGVQPRNPKADATLIDLTNFYTLALNEDASGVYGYTLETLPRGVQKLGPVQYDLRGVVQVSGQQFGGAKNGFPEAVKGIRVGLKCRVLSFLHASRWTEDYGTKIGHYAIHYANGDTWEIPILFGVDVRDWRPMHDPDAPAHGPVVAWRGRDKAGLEIVLFQTQWANPLPDVQITSIDLVSSMTNAAPFLVAVTAQ